jgi:hypothetical protein
MEKVMADGNSKTQQISLGDDFEAVVRYGGTIVELNPGGDVVVNMKGLRVAVYADGSILTYRGVNEGYTNGDVKVRAAANDDAKPKGALEIGAVVPGGDAHAGFIYGGILPSDKKPIWFSQLAPELMTHFGAAAWAEEQGGSLPTRKQGDYLMTLKGKGGAFTEIFNRGGSFPAGFVWLAEPSTYRRVNAWCQRLSDGDQYDYGRNHELPVLACFR